MNETAAKAQRIYHTMQTEGWPDVMTILDEMIAQPKEELLEILAKKPETLIGKTAIAKASRSKGLSEFKEELLDLVAPLNPRQGQRN